MGFPCGSAGKESDCNVGDLGSIPGLGRSPVERNSKQQLRLLQEGFFCFFFFVCFALFCFCFS